MKDYKITAKKSKKDASVSITMEGQLNVANIAGIQTEFTKAVKGNKIISVELMNVEDADVTIIQLLKSFELKCKKESLEFNLNMDLIPDIDNLFDRAGLKTLF